MATTTAATTSATSFTSLDTTYKTMIAYQIQLEGAPLTKLEAQQTALIKQRTVYAELKTKLDALRTSSKALMSADPFYSLRSGRTVSVSNIAEGSTVISAASSNFTVAGTYDISNISLALADRVRSDEQEYSDQALSRSGTIYIGGAETRSIANLLQTSSTVADIRTNDQIAAGQKELGSSKYYVETKKTSAGVWQFRLVDSEGTAAKIAEGTSTTNFSSSWQNIPADGVNRVYSTGRGMSIEFGADPSLYEVKSRINDSTNVDYQAKAAEIVVTEDMSLNDIASSINSGTYASGNEVSATVVNKQLVLSSKLTGESHKIQASGIVLEQLGLLSGSSFAHVLQSGRNATFSVNGLSVNRSQNSALTDVINGVTLNLASDAQGKSATLNIVSDNTAQKTAINTFITNFNSIQSFIGSNLAVTKNSDNTYTRGPLSGDQLLINLRNSLFSLVGSFDEKAPVFKSLKNIGITVDGNLNMAVSDSAKLDNALKSNYSDVVSLMDSVMSSVTSKLDKYTGSTSYVDQLIKANATKTIDVGTSIVRINKKLDAREQSLIKYYADFQAQMDLLANTQNTNSAWLTSLYSSLYN